MSFAVEVHDDDLVAFGVYFDYAVEGYVEGVGGFLPGNLPGVGLENTGGG